MNENLLHRAKDAKFGEIGKYFSLRAWRLGAKDFVEVVLLNILSVRGRQGALRLGALEIGEVDQWGEWKVEK